MAKIELADGRVIPVVKPNLWDNAAIEKEMGWDRNEFQEWMKSTSVQSGVAIYASLRRAGLDVTFTQCMDLDGIETIVNEPGDIARAAGSEGEQTPDPQSPASETPALVVHESAPAPTSMP